MNDEHDMELLIEHSRYARNVRDQLGELEPSTEIIGRLLDYIEECEDAILTYSYAVAILKEELGHE